MKWEDGPLLGEFTTRSFGASPSAGSESLLSQILEDCPHPKYNLSVRACLGVLRRAKRRGKKLPEILDAALKLQICRELFQRAAERKKPPAPFLERYAARIRFELSGEDAPVYCLDGNVIDRDAKQNGLGVSRDVMYTLNTVDRPAVMAAAFSKGQGEKAHGIGWQEETAPSLKAEVNGNNPPAVLVANTSGIRCGNPWDPQTERIYRLEGVWPSLRANNGGGQNREAVLVFDARGNGDGKTVPTITGDHENRITDYTAICVEEKNSATNIFGDTVIPTIVASAYKGPENTQDGMIVCVPDYIPDTAHSLRARAACAFREDTETYVTVRMNVRRLTPLECDRLQGYPDNWTDIGEWTDSKGKKRNTSDSNRYKADGNSIALPFWFWLLRRISAQYERPATLGSLFDGIGGFPLCWERCNGKGTALWASEIDEFAVAVTKAHFPG